MGAKDKEQVKAKIPGERPDVNPEDAVERDRPVSHAGPSHRAEEEAVGGAGPMRNLESSEEAYEGHGFPGMDAREDEPRKKD